MGYKEGDYPVAELLSSQLLSLPIDPLMSDAQVEYVIEILKEASNEIDENTLNYFP